MKTNYTSINMSWFRRFSLLVSVLLTSFFSCTTVEEAPENSQSVSVPEIIEPYSFLPPYSEGNVDPLIHSFLRDYFSDGLSLSTPIPTRYYWSLEDRDFSLFSPPVYPLVGSDIYRAGDQWLLLLSYTESKEASLSRKIIPLGSNPNEISPFSLDELLSQDIDREKPTIIIDPGHGGRDPGAVGFDGVLEKSLNQRLALLLEDELNKQGYAVLFSYPPDDDRYMTMYQRARVASRQENALYISLHHNSSYVEEERGFSLFFSSFSTRDPESDPYIMVDGIEKPFIRQENGDTAIDLYYQEEEKVHSVRRPTNDPSVDIYVRDHNLSERAEESLKLGLFLFHSISEIENAQAYHYNHKLIDDRDYYVLMNNPNPGILLETGFISNPEEAMWLQEEETAREFAQAIARGIEFYWSSSTGSNPVLDLK